jgi:superfamily II RNA helicase
MEENSNSPYLSIFTDKICKNNIPSEDIAYNFPYELDAFQKEGIYRIYKKENILITAHTGSGKTVLAIYAIAHCLKMNKKVLYTSPTKSLSNQKYAEFTEKFGSVGIMTGDIKMNPDAQCIIMTTEILRNILYKHDIQDLKSTIDIKDVGIVIFDEVHYINDPDRGKVWEESIILLPKNVNLVMLSASIDKPELFASWIGNIKEIPISLIPTSHRVVPLKHYYWNSYIYDNNGKDELKWEMVEILDDNGKFKNYDVIRKGYKSYDVNKLMDRLVDFLVDQNYIPALFFKFSRKKCESICKTVRKNLLTSDEIIEVERTFDYYMLPYKKTYEILPQYQDVYKQLLKGVVYHHSGLIPILKEIIEILYSKGLVKILFATETFSIGVNMPTKTVLFTDLEKYDNKGIRTLRTDEYLQMSGRAGRRGLDKFGSVIILPTMKLLDELSLRNMLTGKSPMLNSKFRLSYQFVLKAILSGSYDINGFLGKTLIMNENDKKAVQLYCERSELENKINLYEQEDEDTSKEDTSKEDTSKKDTSKEDRILFENYDKILSRLGDKFFVLKKKDKEKLEKEKKIIESKVGFKDLYDKYKIYKIQKQELDNINGNIWWFQNSIKSNIDIIIQLLKDEKYYGDNKITKKGIIASEINECNELLFTEMIFQGLLDDLDFPEIIGLLSAFINEKDSNSDERYIKDLKVSGNLKWALKRIQEIAYEFIKLEDKYQLYIESDYNLYLDFIEPAYIWASGGTIHDVFKSTCMYDGNFVKAIMRINNICENLMDICKNIERFDICSKLESYNSILIRDITTINSLYI